MGTVPISGTDPSAKDRSPSLLHTFQSEEQSESEPMEKCCIVEESMSESESESSNEKYFVQVLLSHRTTYWRYFQFRLLFKIEG